MIGGGEAGDEIGPHAFWIASEKDSAAMATADCRIDHHPL
jgi:hypothetical protein